MSDFERLYYEDDMFWGGDALQDEANVERINYTARLVPADVQCLVDIGCGNGVFLTCLSKTRAGIRLLGIDRSEAALRYVKSENLLADIVDTGLQSGSFDCVTCLEVIEHLPFNVYDAAIKELARISNKYIIVSVPFEEDLEETSNQCPACKTIFNRELHLRNFNDLKMNGLFNEFGFKCRTIEHLGASRKLKYHRQYRRLLYPEQFNKFESPICPVCGFKLQKTEVNSVSSHMNERPRKLRFKQRILSTISAFPKMFWPKETKFYWVIALYQKAQ